MQRNNIKEILILIDKSLVTTEVVKQHPKKVVNFFVCCESVIQHMQFLKNYVFKKLQYSVTEIYRVHILQKKCTLFSKQLRLVFPYMSL